jgi:hypothetical protein
MDWEIFQEFFYVFYRPALAVAVEVFVAASMVLAFCIIAAVVIFRPGRR